MKERLLSIATCLIIVAGLLVGMVAPALAHEAVNEEAVNEELPETFTKEDDITVTYTSLPIEVKKSFTIVSDGEGIQTGNVISVDYNKGTAVVRDDVKNGESTVSIATIDQGTIFRMYDGERGEHLFTTNDKEAMTLANAGWIHEEGGDMLSVDARDDAATAVYRLYLPYNGTHFLTSDAYEAKILVNSGFLYEGISHYVYDKNSKQGVAQHRLYNGSVGHHWTSDMAECNALIGFGWVDEGVCWNVEQYDGARSKEIVGSFRYIDPDIPELVCTYTFNADGTGTYDIAGEVQKLTYAIYGNELSIMFEGQDIPMNVEFTVDAEALTIVDGTGAYMVYYRI